MFHQTKIQRLILLPFFAFLFVFASLFLAACACQPVKGDQITVQVVSLDVNQKVAKTIAAPFLTKQLVEKVSNQLFNQGQYQSKPPLLIQKLKATKNPFLPKFRPLFFAKTNNRFNPIYFVTQKIIKDSASKIEYPVELTLTAKNSETIKDVAVEFHFFYASKWKIRIVLSKVRFTFPAVDPKKPVLRFANQFSFLNSADKSVDNLTLDQFAVDLVQI